MKEIPLTQGKVALVDDNDFEWLNQWKWFAHKSSRTFYAHRLEGKPKQKTIAMHRFIMNTPQGMETDHRDGNGLNNIRSNLRICTKEENQRNRKMCLINTSGFKGVSWAPRRKKWHCQISINGHKTHSFHTSAEDAARAYDKVAREYFGEFAKTNFPEGDS